MLNMNSSECLHDFVGTFYKLRHKSRNHALMTQMWTSVSDMVKTSHNKEYFGVSESVTVYGAIREYRDAAYMSLLEDKDIANCIKSVLTGKMKAEDVTDDMIVTILDTWYIDSLPIEAELCAKKRINSIGF